MDIKLYTPEQLEHGRMSVQYSFHNDNTASAILSGKGHCGKVVMHYFVDYYDFTIYLKKRGNKFYSKVNKSRSIPVDADLLAFVQKNTEAQLMTSADDKPKEGEPRVVIMDQATWNQHHAAGHSFGSLFSCDEVA